MIQCAARLKEIDGAIHMEDNSQLKHNKMQNISTTHTIPTGHHCVLVLGRNSYIGQNLMTYLLSVLDDADKPPSIYGTTSSELDLTDAQQVDSFFSERSFDLVLHLAMQGGSGSIIKPGDEVTIQRNNIAMFKNVAKWTQNRNESSFRGTQRHIRKLIYYSSGAAVHEPFLKDKHHNLYAYAHSKKRIEKLAREKYFPQVVIHRLYGIFGGVGEPERRLMPGIFDTFNAYSDDERETQNDVVDKTIGKVISTPNKLMDYVWIGDVARVAALYIEKTKTKKESLTNLGLVNLIYPERPYSLGELGRLFILGGTTTDSASFEDVVSDEAILPSVLDTNDYIVRSSVADRQHLKYFAACTHLMGLKAGLRISWLELEERANQKQKNVQ